MVVLTHVPKKMEMWLLEITDSIVTVVLTFHNKNFFPILPKYVPIIVFIKNRDSKYYCGIFPWFVNIYNV